jgi:hypothetical protein
MERGGGIRARAAFRLVWVLPDSNHLTPPMMNTYDCPDSGTFASHQLSRKKSLPMDSHVWSEWLRPITVVVICVAGWIAFSHLLSRMSGWREMAVSYEAQRPFSGTWIRPWAASMRHGVNYNGLLSIGAESTGIYLSVFFVFRAGHPPLFIPFEEISASGKRTWRTMWLNMAQLQFAQCPSAYLLIPMKTVESLSQASGFQFRVEESA